MPLARRLALAALLAAPALAALSPPALRAQDAPAPAPAPAAAPDPKEAKIRRLLKAVGWKDQLLVGLEKAFEQQVQAGVIPPGFPEKFNEVADFEALENLTVKVWGKSFDEKTLDAAIAFFETEEGRKYSSQTLVVTRDLMDEIQPWAMENAMRAMGELMGGDMEEEDEEEEAPPREDIAKDGSIASNEKIAAATLRNIVSCQAQIQTSGKIDCDMDGIGEFGTLMEMAGGVAVRKGFRDGEGLGRGEASFSDFSAQGTPVNPPILSPRFVDVDADGIVRRNGYCFRIYLPDNALPTGFVHETGPKESVALAGGTGRIGVDLSETTFCIYAWPEKRGETGNRVFFTSQGGDVIASGNEAAKWEGARAPRGDSAYLGAGMTSRLAIGTRGNDGDMWRLVD